VCSSDLPALRGKNSGHRFLRPGIGAQSVDRFRREGHHFPLPEHAGRFPDRRAFPQRIHILLRFDPPPKRRLAHMSSSFPGLFLSLSYHRSRFCPFVDQRSSALEGGRSRGWMPTVTFYSLLPLEPSPFPSPSAGSRCKEEGAAPPSPASTRERRHRITRISPLRSASFKCSERRIGSGNSDASAAEKPIASKRGKEPGAARYSSSIPCSRAADRATRRNWTPICGFHLPRSTTKERSSPARPYTSIPIVPAMRGDSPISSITQKRSGCLSTPSSRTPAP